MASRDLEELGPLSGRRGVTGEKTGETRAGTINAWRLAAVGIVNSAIGAGGAALTFWAPGDSRQIDGVIVVALATVVLQVVLYFLAHGIDAAKRVRAAKTAREAKNEC